MNRIVFKFAKIYKLPFLWWNHLALHPFPSGCSSIDEILELSNRYKLRGFNGQCIRAYVLWRLSSHFQCSSFVETGSGHGHTAGFVRRVFGVPVFTCDINILHYFISRAHLFWANQIEFHRLDSPEFLRRVCSEAVIGSNPIFYLDAHWYSHVPLANELQVIADDCCRGIVVIDDFFVPTDARFGYDQYPGFRIDMDVINSTIKMRRKNNVQVYLPAYGADRETGSNVRGFAVVVFGQDKELPLEVFPFNLLAIPRE